MKYIIKNRLKKKKQVTSVTKQVTKQKNKHKKQTKYKNILFENFILRTMISVMIYLFKNSPNIYNTICIT